MLPGLTLYIKFSLINVSVPVDGNQNKGSSVISLDYCTILRKTTLRRCYCLLCFHTDPTLEELKVCKVIKSRKSFCGVALNYDVCFE